MNQDVKALWVEALESGEYKHATGTMALEGEGKDGMNHCCLGVLTVLYAEQNNHPYVYADNGSEIVLTNLKGDYFGGDCMTSAGSYVARAVTEWAGLSPDMQAALAMANDHDDQYPIEMIKAL